MIQLPAVEQWGIGAPMGGECGPADEYDGIRQGRGDAKLLWRST
jgi:hypothetical protein